MFRNSKNSRSLTVAGGRIEVEKTDSGWSLNGRFLANLNVMQTFLETVQKINVRYVPPHAAVPGMLQNLAAEGIRVDLFLSGGARKTYYIGGVTPDDRGTYAAMDGSDQPYVVHLPFFEGHLRSRYTTELDAWRDRTLFHFAPEDIESIAVEYPQYQMESFRLEKKAVGQYEVGPFYPTQPRFSKDLTKGKAEAYLLGFEKLIGEAVVNSEPKKDSILSRSVPFAKITVKTAKMGEQKATFYPLWPIDRDGNAVPPANTNPFFGQVERYHVLMEPSGDFCLAQHVVFGKTFARHGWFFQPHESGIKN